MHKEKYYQRGDPKISVFPDFTGKALFAHSAGIAAMGQGAVLAICEAWRCRDNAFLTDKLKRSWRIVAGCARFITTEVAVFLETAHTIAVAIGIAAGAATLCLSIGNAGRGTGCPRLRG